LLPLTLPQVGIEYLQFGERPSKSASQGVLASRAALNTGSPPKGKKARPYAASRARVA
jgi:hypothetical protein